MPNVYIIVGGSQTGKSRTVRALTGASTARPRGHFVGTTNQGVITVYIQVRSLQEAHIAPQDFINTIQQGNYENVLVTLRIKPIDIYPEAARYIEAFLGVGWIIKHIVLLNANVIHNQPENIPQPMILQTNGVPSNTLASQIRPVWQWQ